MRVYCPGCDVKLKVDEEYLDEKIECPKCEKKFRPSNADEVEEPRAKTGKTSSSNKKNMRNEEPAKDFPLIPVLAGGGGLVILVVVGLIVTALTKKPDPVAQNPVVNPPQQQPIMQNGPGFGGGENPIKSENPFNNGGPPSNPVVPTQPQETKPPEKEKPKPPATPIELLFSKPVNDMPPPKLRAAVMDKDKDAVPLAVPTFFSLRKAQEKPNKPLPKFTKLSLDEVKAATVFIKVDAGDLSSTGSGFYIGAEGNNALVATNHHVIEAAMSSKRFGNEKGTEKPPVITCVFNSGVPGQEWESIAKITAFDPIADLAVLRLEKPIRVPKPIDPWGMPKLSETMEVRICGFPFGAQLATSSDNPNISVGLGSISSLRLNKAGTLEKVQISGALNPGNSGGPIVDKDGRLTGVAVSTISGSGLGFAVPVNDLVAMLEGKILLTEFLPLGFQQDGKAKFKAVVPIMDPRAQVRGVVLRYWAGNGTRPTAVKDARYGHLPIVTPEKQVDMYMPNTSSSLAVVSGDLILPADATEVVVQMATQSVEGFVANSAPVTFKVSKKNVENGSDAKAMSEVLTTNVRPDTTVVMRARILGLGTSRSAHQIVFVTDTNLKLPANFLFFTDRVTASLLDEVDPDDQPKEVRLTCQIGEKDREGTTLVRITRVDFLDEGDTVCHSTAIVDKKNLLSELNRDPASQAGKKITLDALAVPMTRATATSDTIRVMFESFRKPRNLDFVTAKGLNEKIDSEKLKTNGLYKVRLSVTVGDKLNNEDQSMKVTVTKIEILDPKDNTVIKSIE